MFTRFVATLMLVMSLPACNKIPESEEAKKIGNIPKQTIDKAQTDVDKALQQGAQRSRDAEDKADQKQ